ncbi:ABC transporter substrate-binding protein [Kinneretia asaccharophila]|uniref:Iron complex transport system substrate-binding protein n=1 Tax=Roseateles asaccharophilus TaxID=582607 RepID=A0A4V3CJY5_9BURK|nr:ABC transporter substrate-binding protein [Roseateles asaccharophilus]MDN3545180.1 ABC transporter substrate-binding protein [Roseateles asaccharophilus]TDP11433.1 iron complex transport system substrate-binding protein [Roseateles asaccharophilus]
MSTPSSGPQRIACLSTEAVEVLYRLGAQERVAGISGYSVHPPQARAEKPKISGFSSMKLERIQAVQPDLVIGFSDLQRPLLEECERAGLATLWFDQRDLAGIHAMVRRLGGLVGREAEAEALSRQLRQTQDELAAAAAALPWRPRVYFEEWDEPMICGIGWVSELIQLAGGEDVFAERARAGFARERIVTPEAVLAARPQLILGSWCGKRFVPERVLARPGFAALGARLAEIKSADILAPGPAAIERGARQLLAALQDTVQALS